MKLIIVLFALLTLAYCEEEEVPEVAIVRSTSQIDANGSYKYGYETDDGTSADVVGTNAGSAVHGKYSYISPEGETIEVTYTADANGFHPHGAHIPVAAGHVTKTYPPKEV